MAIQSSSQSCPIESRDVLFNPSSTVAVFDAWYRSRFKGSIPDSIACILDLLGIITCGPCISFLVCSRIFLSFGQTYDLIAPDSAFKHFAGVDLGEITVSVSELKVLSKL